MQTKITSEIWDDPDFLELNDAEKLVVFWVLTKCDHLGYIEITPRKFARDLQAPFDTLQGACEGLARGFVKTERGVWVRNYIRRQFSSGDSLRRSNMRTSLMKGLALLPTEVQELVLHEYPELIDESSENKGAYKGLISPSQGTREGEREREGVLKDRGLGKGNRNSNPTSPDLPNLADVGVVEIYQAYPRKVARPAALRAIRSALHRSKLSADALLDLTRQYAAAVAGQDAKFIPHPTTWFNQDRFADNPAEWQLSVSPKPANGEKKEGGGFVHETVGTTLVADVAGEPDGWMAAAWELYDFEWDRIWDGWETVPVSNQNELRAYLKKNKAWLKNKEGGAENV